ncbi:MAG: hypothetical protein A2Y33_09285 [Spirochaetes bacterium GWF1_51_8]|nr:MAG: hypothetical protein A2Y33_09285 [Spirochaetes bacterium GWF1_51_8]
MEWWAFFLQSDLFKWGLLPLLIFCGRLCDVSLGTMRVIFIGKGYRFLAPLIGFFEVMIWLLAMRQIMGNLDNLVYMVVYAAGFAMGNFLGIYIEKRLSLGMVLVRVIARDDCGELIDFLRQNKFGITVLDGGGATGPVKLIFSVMERKQVEAYIDLVETFNPGTFFTVEDMRLVHSHFFPVKREKTGRPFIKRK